MKSLSDRLKAVAAFKKWETCDTDDDWRLIGEQDQHARTERLFAALAECAEALAETSRTIVKPISMIDALIQLSEIETRCDKALAKLEQEIAKMEGEG